MPNGYSNRESGNSVSDSRPMPSAGLHAEGYHGVLQYIGVAAGVTPLLATVGHFDYCVKLPSVWRGVQMCTSIHARSFW